MGNFNCCRKEKEYFSFCDVFYVSHRKRAHHGVKKTHYYFLDEQNARDFRADKLPEPFEERFEKTPIDDYWSDVKILKGAKFSDNTVFLFGNQIEPVDLKSNEKVD